MQSHTREKAAHVLSVQVGIIGGALGFHDVLLDLLVLALADPGCELSNQSRSMACSTVTRRAGS